ncbi:lysosomal alpha-glucosidase isoform X2 [Esox lucius]|nr:lysosomal alpha-glucosidase isoform X2 [Esox lucius]
MVSYKRLSPEDVQFSNTAASEEPPEEVTEVKAPEESERPLLPRRPSCSATTAIISLGFLLLMASGIWLLGTIFWLHAPSSSAPHMAPPPRPSPGVGKAIPDPQACAGVPEAWRFDCYPERGVVVTRELCEARNCCFIPASSPPPVRNSVPWCFYSPTFPSYSLVSLNQTEQGEVGTLVRTVKTYYPKDVLTLQLEVLYETDHRLRVRISDPSASRFEVPIAVPNATEKASSPAYSVELSKDPFGLVVKRTSSGTVLLNTTVAPLFFCDQFLQLSSSLSSQYVYGLGEHRSSFLHDIHWNTLTMWARDAAPMELTNLYGAHPFYLTMEEGGRGTAHGFFLLNSNAMDVVLQPGPAVTWRTIGGILDFYVFLGPDPASVIGQYLEVVGYPSMPVYWALGYHLCRWGYGSSSATWDVVKNMRNYGIPQDVQWNDIDYMDHALDFTFDPANFSTLPDMVKDLHNHGQRYVMILDPGISSVQQEGRYWPYDEGLKRGVFINHSDGKTLIGKVWPGQTAFPDFSDPVTHEWWYDNLKRFHDQVPFDGLWIDMNEPSNFVDGSTVGCPDNELENPPYTPGVLGGLLRAKTVCASALQKTSLHYNMHSLYGLLEAKASANALRRILGKRAFVISRSTFPSQGLYSGHWLGDNRSHWKDMYTSIAGMLTFNLLGVPLVGADVCGFSEQSDEELCVRWTQLGAFYPFSRNHNTLGEPAQDPTAFSPLARAAMRQSLLLRYSLFPLLYTLFHRAHTHGHTVARPLLFEFPEDVRTYGIDKQFLWGRSLLVTPVLDPGVDYVVGYFPQGLWYDYYTGDSVRSKGEELRLHAPLDKINLYLREGAIIPTQRPNTTLWVSSGQPLHLISCLTEDGSATGELFWDDGESLDTFETDQYAEIVFSVVKNTMTSEVLRDHVEASYMTVETASIYGVKSKPSRVTVNSHDAAFSYRDNQVLTVTDLGLNLSQNFTISWM